MKVLVTGGCGFIGSHLVEKLVSNGYDVRVLDNLSRSNIEYIQPLIDRNKVEFIDGDIRYKDCVDYAMESVDYVFHEAATNINRSLVYPEESFDVNFKGSQVVFKSALDNNIKKIIFASSASVYGQPKVLPMSENSNLEPITPYCVSKLSSEYLLKFYSRSGLKYLIFRYFNVYGIRQHTDAYYTSVIILFIKRLLNNLSPKITGDGRQSMDFINVKDIVHANILGMESDIENETINLGTGISSSISDIAYMLIDILGLNLEPEFIPRDILVTERKADNNKAKKLLNFSPKIKLREGLEELIEDIKNNPGRY